MSALTLHPISLGSISKGGYVISYEGTVPAGATLLLGVPDVQSSMDVSRQSRKTCSPAPICPCFSR